MRTSSSPVRALGHGESPRSLMVASSSFHVLQGEGPSDRTANETLVADRGDPARRRSPRRKAARRSTWSGSRRGSACRPTRKGPGQAARPRVRAVAASAAIRRRQRRQQVVRCLGPGLWARCRLVLCRAHHCASCSPLVLYVSALNLSRPAAVIGSFENIDAMPAGQSGTVIASTAPMIDVVRVGYRTEPRARDG